jgi:hypothetical protein
MHASDGGKVAVVLSCLYVIMPLVLIDTRKLFLFSPYRPPFLIL